MRCRASDASGALLDARTYYSVGGGFVVDDNALARLCPPGPQQLRHPLASARARTAGAVPPSINNRSARSCWPTELAWRGKASVRAGLLNLWEVMQACVARGCQRERAARRHACAAAPPSSTAAVRHARSRADPLTVMDWVNLYALAVSEENAAGGRVVTAPTNGAAIIPAVLHYYTRFVAPTPTAWCALLTAGAVALFKLNASISGAEVGCQGEVGSACSMAAGAW